MKKVILALAAILTFGLGAYAQEEEFDYGDDATTTDNRIIAFPGAEGFGKYATGGRGGRVVFVTNLDDEGEGSFRWAVKRKGPKTVLFKVSGTIYLKKPLDINRDSLTIAGQSAPGDGICIAGAPVKINGNNVIIRYLRFRMGDMNKYEADALSIRNHSNIIIDHCSISWSTDECASVYGVQDFTMQWCIISEGLYESVHVKGQHSYGGIWGGKNASFHHNLLAHNDSRNPRIDHPALTDITGTLDIRNNVIYNWGNNATYGGETRTANIINNYYKPGPATKRKKDRIFFQPYNQTDKNADPQGYGTFFIQGNVVDKNMDIADDNLLGIKPQNSTGSENYLTDESFAYGEMDTESADDCYTQVLKKVGCSISRDAVDRRIVQETKTGTAVFGGTYGKAKGIIDSPNDVGGYPELKQGDVPSDADNDGIPDMWEMLHGLNPDRFDSWSNTIDEKYTNLEVYLNSLITDKD